MPMPLVWIFEGDYELRMLVVEGDTTMRKIGEEVVAMTGGRLVTEEKAGSLVVRSQSTGQPIRQHITVDEAGLREWDCIEVGYDRTNDTTGQ